MRGRKEGPPNDPDVERAVLGGVMLENGAMEDEDVRRLEACDFYRDCHRELWKLIEKQYSKGEPIDMVAIVKEAVRLNLSEEVGGYSYISSIPDDVPSTENIGYYARIVKDYASRRALMRTCEDVFNGLAAGHLEVPAAACAMESGAQKSREGSSSKPVSPVENVLIEVFDDLDEQMAGEADMLLPTGLETLDTSEDHGGWITLGITLFIGASGMGKTSLLNRAALGAARLGARVGIYGTETTKKRRTNDLLFSLAGVDQRRWGWFSKLMSDARRDERTPSRGVVDELEHMRRKLNRAGFALSRLDIHIFETGLNVDAFEHIVLAEHKLKPLHLMIADYIQGFRRSRGVGASDKDQVSYTSAKLRETQEKMGCAFLVGSQRSGEKTLNPKDSAALVPQMTDSQHSSKIFQDAEEVYAIYRSDYYRERYPDIAFRGSAGHIEVVARKRRKGKLCRFELPFHGPHQWVGERPQEWIFS